MAPRKGILKIDEWEFLCTARLEYGIRQLLDNAINLPKASSVNNPNSSDYAIDIAIPSYTGGLFGSGNIDGYPIVLFWRPRILLQARLFKIENGETIATFSSSQHLPWRQYFKRIFSVRYILGFKPSFDIDDMEQLLYKGCIQILVRTKSKLNL